MSETSPDSLSAEAYKSASLAEEADARGDFATAEAQHAIARRCFRRILKAIPSGASHHATREALKTVIEHHKSRARAAKAANESQGNSSSQQKQVRPETPSAPVSEPIEYVEHLDTIPSPVKSPSSSTIGEASATMAMDSAEMQDVVDAYRSVAQLADEIPEECRTPLPTSSQFQQQSAETNPVNPTISAANSALNSQPVDAPKLGHGAKPAGHSPQHLVASGFVSKNQVNLSESFYFVQRDGTRNTPRNMHGPAQQRGVGVPQQAHRSQGRGGQLPRGGQLNVNQRYSTEDIALLSETLRTVSVENNNLLKEREALSKAIRERSGQYEKTKVLCDDFRKRFSTLKVAMEAFFLAFGNTKIVDEIHSDDAKKLEAAEKRITTLEQELELKNTLCKKLSSKVRRYELRQKQLLSHAAKVAASQANHSAGVQPNAASVRPSGTESLSVKSRTTGRAVGWKQRMLNGP